MVKISGGDKLEAYLKELAQKVSDPGTLRVGFLENATYPDGTTVATVAAINNFGAPARGIPPRPFFSHMIDVKAKDWGTSLAGIIKAQKFNAKASLELMGKGIEGQLRESIVEMDGPANSPVTNLLKQRFPTRDGMTFGDVLQARRDVAAGETAPAGKPLVWSGHLLNSVDSEVQ